MKGVGVAAATFPCCCAPLVCFGLAFAQFQLKMPAGEQGEDKKKKRSSGESHAYANACGCDYRLKYHTGGAF